MTITRRTFFGMAGYVGMLLSTARMRRAHGSTTTEYTGPLYVTVNAHGGWDPTMLCDPKGYVDDIDPAPVNHYHQDEIFEIGSFLVAPIGNNRAFFERFHERLLVINGIDMQTNSHERGRQYTWSGSMEQGAPAFTCLVAATLASRPPLAFLSHGGYDETADIVGATRIDDVDVLQDVAFPHALDSRDPEESALHTPDTVERILHARAERHRRLMQIESLPRVLDAIRSLNDAQLSETTIAKLSDYLPSDLDSSSNPLIRQAQLSMACMASGLTISTNLDCGGFDTHSRHDNDHEKAMVRLLDGVTFLMDEAERHGLADRLVVLIGSDFGRTPWYNSFGGKDHWSVTSMMAMGPGIPGNRVIGGTDDYLAPWPLDPSSLLPTGAANGIRITPGNIHASLRRQAGCADHAHAEQFPVGTWLPLLG